MNLHFWGLSPAYPQELGLLKIFCICVSKTKKPELSKKLKQFMDSAWSLCLNKELLDPKQIF